MGLPNESPVLWIIILVITISAIVGTLVIMRMHRRSRNDSSALSGDHQNSLSRDKMKVTLISNFMVHVTF